jgi:drug/metabolite transporter (DMT)-like permease
MWILLALTAALGTAAREALVKSAMRPGDAAVVAFIVAACTAAVVTPFALAGGLPVRTGSFWWALMVSGTINAAAAVMVARAVHVSELSLVSPLQSATPAIMVVTGALILGEAPGVAGVAGILLIVIGAYVLNADRAGSLLAPLRALAADPGARLFLGVAAIYAVSGAVDKVGVLASSPLTWAFALHVFISLALLLVLMLRPGPVRAGAVLRRAPLRLGAAGVVMAVGVVAQMSALTLTLAAYVIAVKRTSVLLSVVAGGVWFGERNVLQRLTGAAVMLAGFALITLAARGSG